MAEIRSEAIDFFQKGNFAEAGRRLAEVCKENSEDYEALFLLATCYRGVNHLDLAVRCLERCVAGRPDWAEAYAHLGQVYMLGMRLRDAVDAFRTAVKLAPALLDAHLGLTEALVAARRFGEAVEQCRHALQRHPESSQLYAQLAAALEQTNQLDEAKTVAVQALNLSPGQPQATFVMARVERRTGDLEGARGRLEGLTERVSSPQQKAGVAAELGKTLNALEKYAEAFEAFAVGNRAMASTMGPQKTDAVEAIFQGIEQRRVWFRRPATQEWTIEEPDDGIPSPCFLMGFSRSGTTLTEQILASHPGVVTSGEQPVVAAVLRDAQGILGRPLVGPKTIVPLSSEELTRLRQRYWELVKEMVGGEVDGQLFLDKLPLNLIDLGFIYRLFPRARVVVMIRDPRDTCLSCFSQPFHLNQANVNFLDVERTGRLYAAVMKLWFYYRENLDLSYLELRYEDLVANVEVEARRLLNFLGLEWDERVLSYFEHVQRRDVMTPSYSGVALPIYGHAVGRWHNYETELQPILGMLQPFVEEFRYDEH